MADVLDLRLSQLHRRRRLQRCLDRWGPLATTSCIVVALLIAGIHLLSSESLWLDLPLILTALLVPIIILPRSWALRDSASNLAGHLDVLAEGKGLCMALAAQEPGQRDSDWIARLRRPLEDLRLPRIRWTQAKFLPAAMLCLLFSSMIPHVVSHDLITNHFAPFFGSLYDDAEAMHELGIIDDEQFIQHKELIKELEDQAQEKGMSQTLWQARDNMHAQMELERKNAAQRLAEALSAARQASEHDHQPQQLDKLAAALANLAKEHKNMMPKLNKGQQLQLARMAQMAQHKLNPEQLQALRQHMRQAGQKRRPPQGQKMNAAERKKFAQELLQQLKKEGQQCKNGRFGIDIEALCQGMGRGVGRGPGHVQLTEQDPSKLARGDIEGLMPGAQLNPDGSITIAQEFRDADIDDAALQAAVRAGAKHFDPTAADSRRSNSVPRHRSTIQRYFMNQHDQAPLLPTQTPNEIQAGNRKSPTPEEDEVDIP